MFSWVYVRRATISAARNPGALLSSLQGGDLGTAIHERRMRDWLTQRRGYVNGPRSTFGFKIFLDPEDLSQISALIATSGYLNLPVTSLLLKSLRKGMTMVDVGANLGFYTLLAAKTVGESGRVWSFEPEPRNFSLLTRSVRASGLDNVQAVEAALAGSSSGGRLYLGPRPEPNAHTLTRDRGSGSVEVAIASLDEFWQAKGGGPMDVLKVHVFGDEPLVLGGAMNVLREIRPSILTRFGSPMWGESQALLDDLFAWYDVSEIVESPYLLRRITRSTLRVGVHKGIFLSPKADREREARREDASRPKR